MLKHSHEARSEAFNIVPLGFYVDIYGDMEDTGSECLTGILIRAGLPSRSCWGLSDGFQPFTRIDMLLDLRYVLSTI